VRADIGRFDATAGHFWLEPPMLGPLTARDQARDASAPRQRRQASARPPPAALWTFADWRSVQSTNNHAERSLRGASSTGKLSLASHGEQRIELLAATRAGDPRPTLV